MDKIAGTCDQLIGALEVSKEGVSSYGMRITDKVMGTEFVDRVIGNLLLLKRHIFDLRKFAPDHFQDKEGIKHVVEHLLETSDKLKLKMLENNYFQRTYGYLVLEIDEMITHIIEKMPVHVPHKMAA